MRTSTAAIDPMRTLNRAAAEVLVAHGVRGATDVTGLRPARPRPRDGPRVGNAFVFDAASLPALDGALDLARPASRPAAPPTTAASCRRR